MPSSANPSLVNCMAQPLAPSPPIEQPTTSQLVRHTGPVAPTDPDPPQFSPARNTDVGEDQFDLASSVDSKKLNPENDTPAASKIFCTRKITCIKKVPGRFQDFDCNAIPLLFCSLNHFKSLRYVPLSHNTLWTIQNFLSHTGNF